MRTPTSSQSGFTILELLVVVLIVGLLSSIAIPLYRDTVKNASVNTVAESGRALHTAFIRYNADAGQFPSTAVPPERAFSLTTLSPIYPDYFSAASALVGKLDGDTVLAYDSPNVGGPDSQFWIVLAPEANPGVLILVAHTDDYPGDVGTWFDGVYKIVGGMILPIDS